jgi:hypothetical protein
MTQEQIILDQIAEVKAEMFRLNSRMEEQNNILEAFTVPVMKDEHQYLLESCLTQGMMVNGKKPSKRTKLQDLQTALIEAKKQQLGFAAINDQLDSLFIQLSHLWDELRELTVTLPLSTEDMLQAGAMQSDIYDPLEVCKPEVQEVPQEDPATRAKRRIKESSVLRQALALVKELDNSQRTTCIVYAREHNISSNLAELSDADAQRWIDFILNMLHMEALTEETVKREAKLSQAIAAYTKAEKPQIVTTATKKATAKKIGNAVHVTSGDKIVSIKTRQPVAPVEAAPVVEKPVKEAKKPVEKAAPDSLVTSEQESACLIWNEGEYPGMSIPQGFRVRKEKDGGLYRVDHWNGSQWHTYINKAGKIGYTRHASELKQWFEKWMLQLGIAA